MFAYVYMHVYALVGSAMDLSFVIYNMCANIHNYTYIDRYMYIY